MLPQAGLAAVAWVGLDLVAVETHMTEMPGSTMSSEATSSLWPLAAYSSEVEMT